MLSHALLSDETLPPVVTVQRKPNPRGKIAFGFAVLGLAAVVCVVFLSQQQQQQSQPREGPQQRNSVINRNFQLPNYDQNAFVLQNNSFVARGQKVQLVAGDVHYTRVHPDLWRDRLLRARALGLNTIQTYVPWNTHEPKQGEFEFGENNEMANLDKFLDLANELGLFVLLRVGPFICAEWEYGGFPFWILSEDPNIKLRTYAEPYISLVDNWWKELFPRVVPHLAQNGGPVVMLQIENEFGYWGDALFNSADRQYLQHLISLSRDLLGPDIVLYTTDPAPVIFRGTLSSSDVFSTVDFTPGTVTASLSFMAQNQFNPDGMKVHMCSELYTGWVVNWGEKMVRHPISDLISTITATLQGGGSFSLYMAHGGTNFGFTSGAGMYTVNGFQADITSYDYNAPISESGAHNSGPNGEDKFLAVQNAISSALGIVPPAEPPQPTALALGTVEFVEVAEVIPSLDSVSTFQTANIAQPGNMESLKQGYGFIAFCKQLESSEGKQRSLGLLGIRDRAHVFLDSGFVALVESQNQQTITLPASDAPQQLCILIENMGRLNFRSTRTFDMDGRKGFVVSGSAVPVTLDKAPLTSDWTAFHLEFQNPKEEFSRVKFESVAARGAVAENNPAFWRSKFVVPKEHGDTFVSMRGWGKGVVWVNGMNLGRYWDSKGPQHTLYVPSPLLVEGSNEIVVMELHQTPSVPAVTFVSEPEFDY